MYNIDINKIKRRKLLFIPVLLLGIVLLYVYGYFALEGRLTKLTLDSKIETTSIEENCTIDYEGVKLCKPIYHYLVNNKEYTCKVNRSTSKPNFKNKKNVYYSKSNPEKCVTDYTMTITIGNTIGLIISSIITLVGIMGIIRTNKKVKKIKKLEKTGTLYRQQMYLLKEKSFPLKGRYIELEYTLSNQTKVKLKSDVRYDGKVMDADGRADLLIDESNTKKLNYYIDFDIRKIK